MTSKASNAGRAFPRILDGFVPLPELWTQHESGAPFPSEASARWFLKEHREALVDEGAIAVDLGRIHVHVERLQRYRERVAIQRARRRAPPA